MPKARNINWDEQPLGKISDRRLAELLKCHHTTVRNARRVRNIASIVDQQRASANQRNDGQNGDTAQQEATDKHDGGVG